MLLAIDAGNTNIVFALFEAERIRSRWRISTDPRRTTEEYAAWLLPLMSLEGVSVKDIESVLIASVVPRAVQSLQAVSKRYLGVEALIAGRSPVEWPISFNGIDPKFVGSDCVVNAVAAHALHGGGPLIVLDMGTATTLDLIDEKGNYKGGVIVPGVNTSLDALSSATASLPRVMFEAPPTRSVVGRTIYDQMRLGVYWGYVSMIEGLISQMRTEIGVKAKVVATGGLANLIAQNMPSIDVVDLDLTLHGLRILNDRLLARPQSI